MNQALAKINNELRKQFHEMAKRPIVINSNGDIR